MEFTLLFAALTGVAAGWVSLRLTQPQSRSGLSDLLLGAAFVGLVVGRAASMLGDGVNPITHPGTMLIVRAGVDTGFASLGALAYLAWGSRLQLSLLDAVAPTALAALAGWHGGCLWRGTCLGTASDLLWAYSQVGSAVDRHPVELYTALAFLATAFAGSRLPAREGRAAGLALATAGAIRLATDPMRPSLSGGPTAWYLAAIAVGTLLAFAPGRLPGVRSRSGSEPRSRRST